jgi:divalent metal cation (Fe/Co/Zn/Cd) transporter
VIRFGHRGRLPVLAYLAATALVGLMLNAAPGRWWADPVTALVVAPLVINEGLEPVEGDDRE